MYTKKIITNFKKVKRSAATRKKYKRGTRSQQERGVRKRLDTRLLPNRPVMTHPASWTAAIQPPSVLEGAGSTTPHQTRVAITE